MSTYLTDLPVTGHRFVTGGSRGIGAEVARLLAEAGADVAIVGRDAAGLPTLLLPCSTGRTCHVIGRSRHRERNPPGCRNGAASLRRRRHSGQQRRHLPTRPRFSMRRRWKVGRRSTSTCVPLPAGATARARMIAQGFPARSSMSHRRPASSGWMRTPPIALPRAGSTCSQGHGHRVRPEITSRSTLR